jgi:type II secretory pathway pseudopilin PulG
MSDHRDDKAESGAILIVFMVTLAVAAIALGAAAQAWSTTWRRDNEEELIFRANQYVDGIIAYRKEHGGQFPLTLEDLFKPGPRRLRYIRRLYKDPIVPDGKWGLLYLMPGGQGVYDPKAAEKAKAKASKDWSPDWETAGTGALAQGQGQMPGVTPIGQNAYGSGVPGTGGMPAGSLPPGAIQGNLPPIPTAPAGGVGADDKESVSEPPIGWPIIGVISRATGKSAEDTYKIYKGHDHVDEWQFHVFDRGEQVQTPGTPMPGGVPRLGAGPGIGGYYPMQGIVGDPNLRRGPLGGNGSGARPFRQTNWPPGRYPGGQTPPGYNPYQNPQGQQNQGDDPNNPH